jgi:hypothetical protein
LRKELAAVFLVLLLGTGGTLVRLATAQDQILPIENFIDLDQALQERGFTSDTPFGIDCGTIFDQKVYVTLLNQGLVAELDKNTREVNNIFNDPDDEFVQRQFTQSFFSIARDPNNGNLFINEKDNGKLWRFNPLEPDQNLAWTRIPLIERIQEPTNPNVPHPYVEYPDAPLGFGHDGIGGYEVAPNFALLHTSTGDVFANFFAGGDGTVIFAQGFIWVGLSYFVDWENDFGVPPEDGLQDLNFHGLVKIDPVEGKIVKRIPLVEGIFRDVDSSGTVSAGDLRLANVHPGFAEGSLVQPGDEDIELASVAFTSNEKHTDTGGTPNVFDVGERVYRDVDSSGTVSAGDVRLANVHPGLKGSVVQEGDDDDGLALTAFTSNEKHTDTGGTPNVFDVGAIFVTGIVADSNDSNIFWITDIEGDQVFKFDILTERVVPPTPVPLPDGSFPRGVTTDQNFVYVALNEIGDFGKTGKVARIDKQTLMLVDPIDTGADISAGSGPFTVFVNNELLTVTDQSSHIILIDLLTDDITIISTELGSRGNHFGCVPFDGEFWFAGEGSARVGTVPNSRFQGGRPVQPTTTGGGGRPFNDPKRPNYDDDPPTFGEVMTMPGSMMVLAEIHDAVGVQSANLTLDKKTKIEMTPWEGNALWWKGVIPSEMLTSDTIFFKIVAADYNDNRAEYSGSAEVTGVSQTTQSFKVTPYTMHSAAVALETSANNFIELSTMDGNDMVGEYSDTIVIKNNSDRKLENVRIMLSPEISDSFLLDKYAIKVIEPNATATISIDMVGNPNRDTYGTVTAYDGHVIVMASNHSPVMLPVKINSVENFRYLAHMANLMEKADQRYRISLISSILNSDPAEKSDIEVTGRNGADNTITDASDTIVIRNTGDRTLNNVRLVVLGRDAFLLDRYTIPQMLPNGEISIQMLSRIDVNKYSPSSYTAEIIVAPENGIPIVIPVRIPAAAALDSADEFEVRVDGNTLSKASDSIVIKNTGTRTMDSVRVKLSDSLSSIFTLDRADFPVIAPDEEVVIELRYNAKDLRTFMQDYNGELSIISEHHNMRSLPVNITWNKVESDNFVIYARNENIGIAEGLLQYLDDNYPKIASKFISEGGKATIYMTATMEEMQLISDVTSFYSYSNDVIFICSCYDPEENAMEQLLYRAMIMKYPMYNNMKKIENDNGNWLLHGIAKYMIVKNDETLANKYVDAFKQEFADFQWYGPPTNAEYGSAITFFKYIEQEYGEHVLDFTLHHLGSGMTSNTRCDTLEDCALLRGVYDASGMDVDEKRWSLDMKIIVDGWKRYVADYYEISAEN